MATSTTAAARRPSGDPFYDTPEWRAFAERIRERDAYRCTVATLLGGRCSGALHVNHILPRKRYPHLQFAEDNCGTACAAHHPQWEKIVRALIEHRARKLPRCRHRHTTREGREACERRMARERGLPVAA